MSGQTSVVPESIIVSAAGIVGASAAGRASLLTAAQARTVMSVYSTAEVGTLLAGKADKATTLAGYGITDALALSGGTLTGALAGTSVAWSGNATIGGTLGVTGAATFSSTVGISGTTTLSVPGPAGTGLSIDINQTNSNNSGLVGLRVKDNTKSFFQVLGTMGPGSVSIGYGLSAGSSFSGNSSATTSHALSCISQSMSTGTSKGLALTQAIVGTGDSRGNLLDLTLSGVHTGTGGRYLIAGSAGGAEVFTVSDTGALIATGAATFRGTSTITGLSSTSTSRTQGQLVGSWVSSTDASRKAQVEEKVYDTAARTVARSFANGTNGYKALKVLATAPADADLAASEVVFYTDGSGNLAIKLKDSGGTVRTGTVTLV